MRYRPVLAAVLSGAVLLAACGDDDDSASPEGATTTAASSAGGAGATTTVSDDQVSAADVTFVQSMIPHHQQALEMATIAEAKASSPEVKALAGRIVDAQQPEIDQMTSWLEAWGEDVPDEGMAGHDMGSMSGMMSDEDMAAMEQMSGPAFDRAFLEGMIEHHRGAIEMAETELSTGLHPDALALAESIVEAQEAEIAEMQELLAQLG